MVKRLNEELMADVLSALRGQKLTGAQVFNALKETRHGLSKRLVYHYLYVASKRGLVTYDTVIELGDFSWGKTAEKKYYRLAKA